MILPILLLPLALTLNAFLNMDAPLLSVSLFSSYPVAQHHLAPHYVNNFQNYLHYLDVLPASQTCCSKQKTYSARLSVFSNSGHTVTQVRKFGFFLSFNSLVAIDDSQPVWNNPFVRSRLYFFIYSSSSQYCCPCLHCLLAGLSPRPICLCATPPYPLLPDISPPSTQIRWCCFLRQRSFTSL